jgi:hypothetical protein
MGLGVDVELVGAGLGSLDAAGSITRGGDEFRLS